MLQNKVRAAVAGTVIVLAALGMAGTASAADDEPLEQPCYIDDDPDDGTMHFLPDGTTIVVILPDGETGTVVCDDGRWVAPQQADWSPEPESAGDSPDRRLEPRRFAASLARVPESRVPGAAVSLLVATTASPS